MGIPKFYRWISERYPCLSQVVKDYQVPEFDNFYLDMNGIIHVCSHPNDDDPTFRISEDKIFADIFRYIESLFRMIKPRKVLFLAVDGVAPRAKMNQQRGRRFRSAREAQDVVRKALQKGQVLPSEPRFDSNCITPGTEFMARLHEQLKYFVNQKVATDPSWQAVDVVLSGQEVPGEGEHKIMDYIRHQKAQSGYDPNTRHCLYGLDADLIMLGLVTHEPHFCLLREEIRFGKKNQKRNTSPSAVTFHLLHLTILREYIEHEFFPLKTSLSFPYSLESIIDDWVLLCFLVGNDFLPNLPNMHIKQSTLPYLYKKYTEVLPKLDGYINEAGYLNMRRFETYMTALAEFDYDHYSELIGDMKWLAAKTGGSKKRPSQKLSNAVPSGEQEKKGRKGGEGEGEGEGGVGEGGEGRELVGFFSGREEEVAPEDLDDESEATVRLKRDLGIASINAYFEKEDDDCINSFESDLFDMKSTYYREKLGFSRIDGNVLVEQANCYVVGVQWVLSYYYHGVPSWSWFYPYHYAPFVSDVRGFGDLQIEFELGTPFLPFQQLLGVLPPASRSLLPKPYQALMVNDDSPIKDYYPIEFHTDLNGKMQEWEAVVLIPFIDEDRLLTAMREKSDQLMKEEVGRNVHGVCQVYRFDPNMEAVTYASPWPQVFPDVTNCRVKCSELPAIPFPITRDKLVPGLMPGVKLDIFFPGFPTLKHVCHTARLESRGVRVFQAASREDNMCLTVLPRQRKDEDLFKLATELVGTQCYVGWPYLTESKVHAVSDGVTKYSYDPLSRSKVKIVKYTLKEKEATQWHAEVLQVTRQYAGYRGIDVPPIEVLVYANILQGKRYITDKDTKGTLILHKEWRQLPEPHPYDLTVIDIAAHAPEYKERGIALEELFKPKEQCFLVANPHYGYQAEIISVDPAQVRVHIRVRLLPEPDMAAILQRAHHHTVSYLPSYLVAKQLGLRTLVLSRISGNIQVEKGTPQNAKERERVNIGLNLKFDKRNKELPGYCRKTEEGWSYSPAAISLVEEFVEQFPALFNYLHNNPKEDKYYESEILGGAHGETLGQVQNWLKKQSVSSMETVECGGQSLDSPQIAALEKAISEMKQQMPKSSKVAKLRVKPAVLFMPSVHQGAVVPDPKADYFLYDRVITVRANTAVPFGLKGTVIGIRGDGSEVGTAYEILFDDEFLGGLTLRCSPNRAYCLPPSCLLNLSYGARLKAGKSTPKSQNVYRQGQSYSDGQNLDPQGGPYSRGQNLGPQGGLYSSPMMTGTRYAGHHVRGHSPHQYYNGPVTVQGGTGRNREGERGRGTDRGWGGSESRDWRSDTSIGWGGQGGGEMGRGRGREWGGSKSGDWRRDADVAWEGDRGRGRKEKEASPKIIMRNPKSRGSLKSSATSERASPGSQSQKQILSPPSKPRQEQLQHHEENVREGQDGDTFSAALTALEKLEITSSVQSVEKDKQLSPEKSDKSSSKRELSPSVAAVFESVEAGGGSQASLSPAEVPTRARDDKEGPSMTLKAMLKMEEKGGHTNQGEREMPEAIQKLMQPASSPRGPLLPYPRPPLQPPQQAPIPRQPSSQFFPRPPRGGLDYSSGPPPPPLMPFGPPPMDPISALQHTCHMMGQPPPRLTIRLTEQGYVGMATIGSEKCHGRPCATQDEARQSAAAMMNSTMAPVYYPMPYMPPLVPGPYSGPPVLPPHVPPYFQQMPYGYHPRGPQPIIHQSNLPPPSFVPLQVQRRQGHRLVHKQQEKQSASKMAPAISRRPGSGKVKSATDGKPAKQGSVDAGEEGATSACITDDEKVVEKAKQSLQSPLKGENGKEEAEQIGLDPNSSQGDSKRGAESDALSVEPADQVVTGLEERMVERLETAHREGLETQQRIARLTQTLAVMQDPILPPHVVFSMQTTAEGSGEETADSIAHAAIASALEADVKDNDGQYLEPVQSSDALIPGGGGVAGVVHVVGEILGGGGVPTDPSHPHISQGGRDPVPQSHSYPTTDDDASATSNRPAPDQTTTDQKEPKEATATTGANTRTKTATSSPPPSSSSSSSSSNVPSSSVKTSRPKRQLAASFSKSSTT